MAIFGPNILVKCIKNECIIEKDRNISFLSLENKFIYIKILPIYFFFHNSNPKFWNIMCCQTGVLYYFNRLSLLYSLSLSLCLQRKVAQLHCIADVWGEKNWKWQNMLILSEFLIIPVMTQDCNVKEWTPPPKAFDGTGPDAMWRLLKGPGPDWSPLNRS